MHAIEVINLKKYFGQNKAVDDISFTVNKGEIFGFLGPNGAGKTTTIRCMTDLIRPNSGAIKILDKDAQINSVKIKKEISYLPCGIQFYDTWTGQDYIDFVKKFRGSDKKTAEYIQKLDFNPKARVKNLSTGNKQKLGLILSLINQPKLLILDEPTSGLDPLLQNQIYEILRELVNHGSTVFMSSHNLHEVEELCSNVAIIKNGKLVTTESITSLKQKRVYSISAIFEQKINPHDFNFAGVKVQQKTDKELILNIKEDINPLIKKLSAYKLKTLEINLASLDDIFMEFYERT
jgi:ABC-2 type transport system ATP-binding protein